MDGGSFSRDIKSHASKNYMCKQCRRNQNIGEKGVVVPVVVVVVVLEPRSIAIANAWTHDDARGRTSGGCKRPTPEDGCRVRACESV
jgi:hypothetical protein